MRNIFCILSFLILVGCKPQDSNENPRKLNWEDFSILEIKSEKYVFEEIVNPKSLGFNGEKVFIGEDWRVPEKFPRMHLINSSDWTYDKPKGKHGQGPFEVTDAAQFLFSHNPNTFWIYNMNRRKLVEFSLNDTSLLGINEWKLSEPMAMTHFLEKASDSTFLTKPWEGTDKILEFNREGKLVGKYGQWEKIPERPDLTLKQISEINTGWFKGNPRTGIYLFAGIYRDLLEIFDYQTKSFITVYGPNHELPLFDIHETAGPSIFFKPETKYRYRDMASTGDFIFALYGGHSEEDYKRTGIIAEQILIFDHLGKPLWNLKLDRSIIEFVINEEKNQIYGLTTDEDPGIAVFDIPEEIKEN